MAADTTYPGGVVQIRQDGNLAVPTGKSIDVESGATLKIAGVDITTALAAAATISAAELGFIDGVTAGTAAASKALVLGASSEIATITSATITTLTATTVNAGGVVTATGGVAAAGGFAARPRGIHTGMNPATVSTDGFNATPSTTETYVQEVFVPCNMTITGVALFNGSDVTGNVTVGLATSAGAPIAAAKSASTAGSGTDAYQLVPFATPYAAVGPATYYLQVQYSSATARYNAHVLGTHSVLVQTGQTYGVLASFTAPTTFVTNVANIASLY